MATAEARRAAVVIIRGKGYRVQIGKALKAKDWTVMSAEACPGLNEASRTDWERGTLTLAGVGESGPFGAVVLDAHAPYEYETALRTTPGMRFLRELRAAGYRVPVLVLTWYDPERLRRHHAAESTHLLRYYQGYRHREGQEEPCLRSFRVLRLPAESEDVVEALSVLTPTPKSEWEDARRLRDELIRAHAPQIRPPR